MDKKPTYEELEQRVKELEQQPVQLKGVEEALLQSEERYRTIFESTGTATITGDESTTILMMNSEFENLSGYSKEEIEGKKSWTEFVEKDDLERLKEYHRLRRIDPSAAPRKHEFRFINRQGEIRHIFATVAMIPGTKIGVSSFSDITNRKRAEEVLERTNRKLELTVKELRNANKKILEQQKSVIEEERLKILLQMAGTTAHELSQPLMALMGSIQLMEFNKDDADKVEGYMAKVSEAGQRIADIVKKIQTIRHDETMPHVGGSSIIRLNQKIVILSVEDSDHDFERLHAILKDYEEIKFSRANSIEQAFCELEQSHFDLIFLDYYLPDGSGIDFLKRMEKKGLGIPVVVITGQGDEMVASQVIKAGAYDYLPKDKASPKSLSRVISFSLEKFNLKRQIKEAQKKMAEMSTKDELTGLYNRRYFMEALEREVSRAKRYEAHLALCMMDLDHFKNINDSYGHTAGDMVLTEIAKMIKKCLRQSDLCCRYGGEEFAVILPDTESQETHKACERLREMVAAHQFQYNLSQFHCTLSVGFALYKLGQEQSPNELIEAADRALYRAKKEGRNRVVELG